MPEHHHEPSVDASTQAAEWDARYSEAGSARWSGRPNGRLVAEVASLVPGPALDVGCGEGADAIWLAERGWDVTAIDVSDVALTRARAAAERAGVVVDWVAGDAFEAGVAARSFDLVSLQYPALPKAAGDAAVRTLLDAVRPGGLVLAVYHDLDDEHREHMKARGTDPAAYVGVDDLAPCWVTTSRSSCTRWSRAPTRPPAPLMWPTWSCGPGGEPDRARRAWRTPITDPSRANSGKAASQGADPVQVAAVSGSAGR